MVKATDSHNQAVIRANEENVAKLRQERLERERKEREESRKKEDERRSSRHHRHHHEDRHHRSDSKSRSERETKSPERASSSRHKRRHRSKSPTRSRRDKKRHRHDKQPETAIEDVQFKGRGKVKINSSMDKYFLKGYDPLLDVESDKEDDYVFALDNTTELDKKKKKKKRKSKSSSSDRKDCISDSGSDSSNEIGPKAPVVRAWDVGKI